MSFIFINPTLTKCQHRPVTCNIFTKAGSWVLHPLASSVITEDKEVPAEGTLLAPGFKLRELLPLSIEITQGALEPPTRLVQFPMLDGLNIPPIAVISTEISKCMVAAGLSF